MWQGFLTDNKADRAACKGLLAIKGTRALTRARAMLADGAQAKDITDELNTGKLTRLMLWQVEVILASYREKRFTGRGTRVRPQSGRRNSPEKPGAGAGDFCYSICRQDRVETAGTV